MTNEYLKRKKDENFRKVAVIRTNKIMELIAESNGDLFVDTNSFLLDLFELEFDGLHDAIINSFRSEPDLRKKIRYYNQIVSQDATVLTSQHDPKSHVAIISFNTQKLKKTNIPGFKRNVWVEKFVRFSDEEYSWIQTILTNKNGRQIDITQAPKPSPMMIRVAH